MSVERIPELFAKLDQGISQLDLEQYRDRILSASRPAITLLGPSGQLKQQDDPVSRVGGLPTLPAMSDWPMHGGKNIPFVAQLDFSKIPTFEGCPIPNSGWLFLFACYNDDWPLPYATLHDDCTSDELRAAEMPDAGDLMLDWEGQGYYDPFEISEYRLVAHFDPEQVIYDSDMICTDDALSKRFCDLSAAVRQSDKEELISYGHLLGWLEEDPSKDARWSNVASIYSRGPFVWCDSGVLQFYVENCHEDEIDFDDVAATVYST